MRNRLHMSRRTFLKVFGASVASLVVSLLVLSRFGLLERIVVGILTVRNPSTDKSNLITGQALPIPEFITGDVIDGQKIFNLTIQPGAMAYVLEAG